MRAVSAGLLLTCLLSASSVFADPPGGPTALHVTAPSPATIALSWSPSPDASTYSVYRDYYDIPVYTPLGYFVISSTAVKIGTVTGGTTYTDTTVSSLVRYHYAVTAVNDEGESVPSNDAFVTATAPPDAPIVGMADVHNHMFSNLGFGGAEFWGKPWDPGGLSAALPSCEEAHGPFGLFDLIGNAASGMLWHGTHGDPDFDGWPTWNTHTHQQMYIDWVERAFLGGVKLMVMHAVSNEVLCKAAVAGDLSCNDMEVTARQLEAVNAVARNVDWFKIARTPAEARQIINSGRMAVVLGIEVDSLFDCKIGAECTLAHIQERLRTFYTLGVRHIYPIHLFDNEFGGAAMYDSRLDSANKLLTGNFYAKEECASTLQVPEGQHGFQVGPFFSVFSGALDILGIPQPPVTGNTADCNGRGLTPLGASLVKRIMSRGMVLDVDHMSGKMFDAVLSIAESLGYPVVAGHAGAVSLTFGNKRAEGEKTDAQIARIHNLHGLVAPILAQGSKSEIGAFGPVANDCSNSSQQWAQMYFYMRDKMPGAAIGFGSDFNGFAGEPGPRFGSSACPGDSPQVPQSGGVQYPFVPIHQPAPFNQSYTGRFFNYNTDGLAHYGLIPDFIEDLRSQGVSDDDLAPLFNSAEAYIQLWERARQIDAFAPGLTSTVTPAPNASGWSRGGTTVNLSGRFNPDGLVIVGIDYSATGAQPSAPTRATGASAQFTIDTDGETTVHAQAVDEADNHSPDVSTTVRIDRTAPSVTCGQADADWHASDVSIPCTASDALSRLASPADASFALTTAVPAGTETSTATTDSRIVADKAGNTTTAAAIGDIKVDKKAPSITIASPTATIYALNQPVTVTYQCADGGSGVASCAGPAASGAPLATTTPGASTVTVTGTDRVGNVSTRSVSYTVAYNVCLQFDSTHAWRAGGIVPIRVQLCDVAGANASSPSVVVTATGVTRVSDNATGVLDDAGNATPDLNFHYAGSGASASYAFNLSLRGYTPGTYALAFTVSGDPTAHAVSFQVR